MKIIDLENFSCHCEYSLMWIRFWLDGTKALNHNFREVNSSFFFTVVFPKCTQTTVLGRRLKWKWILQGVIGNSVSICNFVSRSHGLRFAERPPKQSAKKQMVVEFQVVGKLLWKYLKQLVSRKCLQCLSAPPWYALITCHSLINNAANIGDEDLKL